MGQARRDPRLDAGRRARRQWTDAAYSTARSKPPAPTSAATRSSGSRATLQIDAGAPVGDGRMLCSVATRRRTEIAQTSGGLRATYPRSSEAGIFSQDVPETSWSTSAPAAANWSSSNRRPSSAVHHRTGRQARMAQVRGGHRAPQVLHRRRQAQAGPRAALLHRLEDDRGARRRTSPARSTTSAGEATARTAGALPSFPPPIDEEAEEENEEQAEEEAEESEEEG